MMKLCMFLMFFDFCLFCIQSAKGQMTNVSFRFETSNSIFPILGTKPVEILGVLIHRTSVFPGQRRC